MGTNAVAQLGAIGASGLSTTLPRRDVERAVKAKKGPPELILDVTRTGDGETRSVAVQWTKADLEELLAQSTGDSVTLTFSGDDLLRAFEGPDVEPHGVKEAVLIAVAAGSLAGAAAAAPADIGSAPGDPGHAAKYTAIEQARAQESGTTPTWRSFEEAGARADQMGAIEQVRGEQVTTPTFRSLEEAAAAQARSDEMGAIEQVRGATPDTAPGISPDRVTPGAPEYGAPRAMPADYAAPTEVASPDRITPAAPEYGMPQATPADYATPTVAGEVASPDVVQGGYGAPAEYGVPRAMPADYATPTTDTGGGISIEAPSPTTTGLIAGALGLAITAAAFAFERRRRFRPQT